MAAGSETPESTDACTEIEKLKDSHGGTKLSEFDDDTEPTISAKWRNITPKSIPQSANFEHIAR